MFAWIDGCRMKHPGERKRVCKSKSKRQRQEKCECYCVRCAPSCNFEIHPNGNEFCECEYKWQNIYESMSCACARRLLIAVLDSRCSDTRSYCSFHYCYRCQWLWNCLLFGVWPLHLCNRMFQFRFLMKNFNFILLLLFACDACVLFYLWNKKK